MAAQIVLTRLVRTRVVVLVCFLALGMIVSCSKPRFVCKVKRGADVRPDFDWNKTPVKAMGYR